MNLFAGKNKKTVLLIGCSGVLGSKFVSTYKNTYKIIGVSRSGECTEGCSQSFKCDISDIEDVGKLVDEITKGKLVIDVVVHNAVRYDLVSVFEKKPEIYLQELKTSLVGPLELSNKILESIWLPDGAISNQKNNRSIINITSGSGLGVIPNQGQSSYSAIKSALHMMSKHMSIEYAEYGVRVNAVAPGWLGDRPTLDTTVAEISKCIDDKSINGQIRATDGRNVQVL